jgi:oligoribonuclease NrnB/cAMP/cGMP phosphodiesterase (DHH superfamily)
MEWIAMDYISSDPAGAPEILRLIDSRDRWTGYRRDDADILHSYLSQNMARIGELMEVPVEELLQRGKYFRERDDFHVKSLLGSAMRRTLHIDGKNYEVAFVNSPLFGSEIGNDLLKQYPDVDFSYTWRMTSDGKYAISLRSDNNRADVAAIAQKFNGGGHRNAAGCIVENYTLE